jgi:hypothetical protein
MEEPTNAVLAEQIRGFRELVELKFEENRTAHKVTNNHLYDLNGQVKKNTKFRIQGVLLGGLAVLIIPTLLTFFLNKII